MPYSDIAIWWTTLDHLWEPRVLSILFFFYRAIVTIITNNDITYRYHKRAYVYFSYYNVRMTRDLLHAINKKKIRSF